jgi:hypothetical protein
MAKRQTPPARRPRASASTTPRRRAAAAQLPDDLRGLTKTELLDLARRAGLRGYSRLSKAALIQALAPHKTPGTTPASETPRPSTVRLNHEPALPARYGVTELVALPVDPFMVHLYWELTPDAIDAARRSLGAAWNGAVQVLRGYDVAWIEFDGTNAHRQFDIEVGGDVGSWYVHLWGPEQTLLFDIGWRARDGRFVAAARSNLVRTPRNAPCEAGEERWMTVRDGRIVPTPAGAIPKPAEGEARAGALPGELPWSGTLAELRGLAKGRSR